jgi:hypothetical protein
LQSFADRDIITGVKMPITDNHILNQLTKNNIDYMVTKEGVKIDGFYKSDTILLVLNDETGEFLAIGRYDDKRQIRSFEDLIIYNYDWWLTSEHRYKGWEKPNPKWIDFILKLGLRIE